MKPQTIDDEITDTRMERPYVLVLGAGASLATTPRKAEGWPTVVMLHDSALL